MRRPCMLLAQLTVFGATSASGAQEPFFVAMLGDDAQSLTPVYRYHNGSWTDLRFPGITDEARRDSVSAVLRLLPSEWHVPGIRGLPFPVSATGSGLDHVIREEPFTITPIAFSQVHTEAQDFYHLRDDVVAWGRLLRFIQPLLDSAEVAWVASRPDATSARIPTRAAERLDNPAVFTTIARSRHYIWYEIVRPFPRSPDHPVPECWDGSQLSGWLLYQEADGPERSRVPWGGSLARLEESFRVTACEDKVSDWRPVYSFRYDDREFVIVLWEEYDSDEGPVPIIYEVEPDGLAERVGAPAGR